MMHRVSLKGLAFKAYHGYYEEERKKGNHFEVDITVTTDFEEAAKNDDLHLAINYEKLYAIVNQEMQVSASLLENVVWRIAEKVLQEMEDVEQVYVSLCKLNPPIQGNCQKACVELTRQRN
ncbi:MAG: dihydroneopterin aldolase [Fulvivirga sp.]|nr:dihydroneopterin aldolase [Fulvivirga sp.]